MHTWAYHLLCGHSDRTLGRYCNSSVRRTLPECPQLFFCWQHSRQAVLDASPTKLPYARHARFRTREWQAHLSRESLHTGTAHARRGARHLTETTCRCSTLVAFFTSACTAVDAPVGAGDQMHKTGGCWSGLMLRPRVRVTCCALVRESLQDCCPFFGNMDTCFCLTSEKPPLCRRYSALRDG